ncbi:MAG: hypothetical protein O3A46_14970 [Candidatus Poribacteria bacterium]|nr:hypothetical protein [Candidatus Poribacteria bacterium]
MIRRWKTFAWLNPGRAAIYMAVCTALLPGCAPLNVPLAPYEDANYLYFAGSAQNAASLEEGRNLATEDALAQLARYFGVSVTSELTVRRVQVNDDLTIHAEDVTASESLRPFIRHALVQEIVPKKRGDRYDVMIRLRYPKMAMERETDRIETEQRQRFVQAQTLFSRALDADDAADAATAITHYLDAITVSQGLPDASVLRSEIREALTQLVTQLRLESYPAPEDPSVMRVRLVRERGSEDVPIGGFPVRFDSKWGERNETMVHTDRNGFATYSIGASGGDAAITAQAGAPSWVQMIDSLPDESRSSLLIVRDALVSMQALGIGISFPSHNARIVVRIDESDGTTVVNSIIEAMLSELGLRIVSSDEYADFVVTGDVNTTFSSVNQGNITSAHANGTLRIVHASSLDSILTLSADGVRGFGSDLDRAAMDARRNLARLWTDELRGKLE